MGHGQDQLDNDVLFKAGNDCALNNNFEQAVDMYKTLIERGGAANAGVVHNLALAVALAGNAVQSMELLDTNMQSFPKYTRSHMLAAELYRRAFVNKPDPSLLNGATALLAPCLGADTNNPQSCIIASELYVLMNMEEEAINWHIRALGAAKARGSKLARNFAAVMLETFADEALHIFSQPPVQPVVTGSSRHSESGKCLAVVLPHGDERQLPDIPDTTTVLVTYSDKPTTTRPGHLHVRTSSNWAAVMKGTQALLSPELQVLTVWNPTMLPEYQHSTQERSALITLCQSPLSLFSLRPSSLQELNILKALYDTINVPPSAPTQVMASAVWEHLAKDSELDVERLT